MTSPEQYLHEGNPDAALARLQEQVRKNPADARLRVFLFQLLAVQGQWERALTQLNVAGELDAANLLMVQTYREAIRCEALRSEVFAGRRTPLVFDRPEEWLALLIESLRQAAGGDAGQARCLREQALAVAPATGGRLNDAGFAWIADADSRLGPALEAIVNGCYYWIPFQQIRRIEIEAPSDLRDFVWMPAVLTWVNGGQAAGLIPTRYPDTESQADALLRMSRRTDWIELAEGDYRGLGQRILATDADEVALMDVRLIELDSGAA